MNEGGIGTTRWRVQRWDEEQTLWVAKRTPAFLPLQVEEFDAWGVKPYSVTEVEGNLITTAGWTRLMNLLTNQNSTQALTATAVRIGVGNSNTAEAYTDTDLGAAAGSSNRYFMTVGGAGTLGTRTLAWTATFGSTDGNFAWNEFGIDVGTPSVSAGTTVNALLFNHKAGIAQGTKASGQTWAITATLTFT